jgi:hypothetical protein
MMVDLTLELEYQVSGLADIQAATDAGSRHGSPTAEAGDGGGSARVPAAASTPEASDEATARRRASPVQRAAMSTAPTRA